MTLGKSWWCNICDKEISNVNKHLDLYPKHWCIEILRNEAKVIELPIYGQNFKYIQDNKLSSTVSEEWQNKIRLEFYDLTPGYYRISWYCEVKPDDGFDRHVNVRVRLDSRENLGKIELAGISDNVDIPEINKGLWQPFSGFCYKPLTGLKHHINLEYCSSGAEGAIYIRRARLEIWRAS